MGKGSAPAQPSTTTQVQDIPEWERKYVENLLGQAQTIAKQPYKAFQGPQIAGFTPDQQKSFSMIENAGNTYLPTQQSALNSLTGAQDSANNIYGAGAGDINESTAYNPLEAVTPFLGSALDYNTAAAGQPWLNQAAGFQNQAASAATPGGIQSYMSPYTQSVVQGIQDQANQNWNQNIMPGINDKFVGSGQYGSGRNAQVLGQAAGNFQTGLSANVANALESGYGQASQNAANQAQLLGSLGSQSITGAGTAGSLQNQQFGNLLNAANTAGTAANQQAGNLQNAGTALGSLMTQQAGQQIGAGAALGSLSAQQQQQALTQAQALQAVGQQQQQLNQANIDVAKQNWQDQVNYPKEQTQYLNQIIRGLPAPVSSTTSALNTPANSVSPLLGLGTSAGIIGSTISSALNKAEGGLIKGYAGGGMVDDEGYADESAPDEENDNFGTALDFANYSDQTARPMPESVNTNSIEALSTPQNAQDKKQTVGDTGMTPAEIQQNKLLALARGLLTPTPGGDPFAALGQGLGAMQDYDTEQRKLSSQERDQQLQRAMQQERLGIEHQNADTMTDYRNQMLALRKQQLNPAPPVNSDVTGDEYLKTLPKSRADNAKAAAEGRLPLTAYMLKSPYGQQLLADAMQYDPTFDATKASARSATRKDFASGKAAQNMTSLNTALGHLETLSKAAKNLDNAPVGMWNYAVNKVESAAGDKRVREFNVAADALASELTRVFRGSGGSVHDITEWRKNLSVNDSPEQQQAAIQQATDLLNSRLQALGDQYKTGMGQNIDPADLLSPKARKAYDRIIGGDSGDADESQSAKEALKKLIAAKNAKK